MRFIKAFSMVFCILAVLFVLPTFLSWDSPVVDGVASGKVVYR